MQDDGRGIPVDKHPQTKTSAMEVIFTTLHAGGKFEGQNYKTAGGLHGVGASVVNALSRDLVATVRRDGATWEQKYKQGNPVGGVKKIGPARGTGTTVFFRPDPQIFPKTEFDASLIRERLEIASYLHKGLKINFLNEAATGEEPQARDVPARRRHHGVPEEAAEGSQHEARARAAVRGGERARRERDAAGFRDAVDRGHRRAPEELRQRHSDGVRRHARERPARRASARRFATSSTRTICRRKA